MNKVFNSIPCSRLIIYSVIFGVLSLFLIGYLHTKKKKEWDSVADRILAIHTLSEQKTRNQAVNSVVRKKYATADSFYLDNQIETLSCLKKEREALERLIHNPSFTWNEAAERRYAFITGEANHLRFTQGTIHSGEGIQETVEVLAHSAEIDVQDLKELLARIEGNFPGQPQLIVTDFKLNKKAHPNGNEVFELNLKLLKREFVQ